MKVNELVRDVIDQIKEGCKFSCVDYPHKIEFSIQINSKGEVCQPSDFPVSTLNLYVFCECAKTESSKKKDYILHLRCSKCLETDLVFMSKYKDWNCPYCEFRSCALNSMDQLHKSPKKD